MWTPDQIKGFQQALVEWFAREGKDYPWRRTTDPYAILVSEIMLQQTTIAMVLERGHYTRWMAAFPNVTTLAAAPEAQVLALWEGLGYYNRARNLHKAAQVILAEHGGVFPQAPEAIRSLPGVGRYTAGAVLSFAYDKAAPLVDGNVARVFARLMDYQQEVDAPAGQKQLWAWAEALLPTSDARRYNSALMELGQRLCTAGTPTCLLCPVRAWCRAKDPASLPRKKPKRAVVELEEHVLCAMRPSRDSWEILLQQEGGSRRRGLWKLPVAEGRATAHVLWQGRYTITHHRVALRVSRAEGTPELREGEAWISASLLPSLPMPSPFRRALLAVLAAEGKTLPMAPP